MIEVSDGYKKVMTETIQPLSYIRIKFYVIDSATSEGASITTSPQMPFSDSTSITGIDVSSKQYITFEPNFWSIDDTQRIVPTNFNEYIKDSYISEVMCGANRTFESNPAVHILFDKIYTAIGITFTFDVEANEYPTRINFVIKKQGTITQNIEISPTASVFAFEHRIEEFDELHFEFLEMNVPFRRLRINNFLFGLIKTWTDSEIESATHNLEIDPISSQLPSSRIIWDINNIDKEYNADNPNGIWKYLSGEQPLTLEYGVPVGNKIEWLKNGRFITNGSPKVNGTTAKFEAVDLLSTLTKKFEKGVYRAQGISLYDLALEVLQDADIPLINGLTPWRLDDKLKDVMTTAPLPQVTHKECLQIIANAGRCALQTDTDGYIAITFQAEPIITITDNGGTPWSSSHDAFNRSTPVDKSYLTFTPDTWLLENLLVVPDDINSYIPQGFMSREISNENGIFSNKPIISIKYSYPIDTYQFGITFDTVTNVIPVTFNVVFSNNDSVIHTEVVTNNVLSNWEMNKLISNFDKIEIIIKKINKPSTRVKIERIGKGRVNDYYLDFTVAKEEPPIRQLDPLRNILVNTHSFALEESKEVYKGTVDVYGTVDISVSYNKSTNHIATVTGGGLVSVTYYAEKAILKITANGSVSISIAANPLVDNPTSVILSVNEKGNDCPIDNPLITNRENAFDVAQWIGTYLSQRNSYELDFRQDYRLCANDVIYFKSMFEDRFPVRITKLAFQTPGQFGKIAVRRLH